MSTWKIDRILRGLRSYAKLPPGLTHCIVDALVPCVSDLLIRADVVARSEPHSLQDDHRSSRYQLAYGVTVRPDN